MNEVRSDSPTWNHFSTHSLAPLRSVKSTYKTPWYLRAIRAIVHIFKKVISYLFFWIKRKGSRWTEREVAALNRLRNEETERAKCDFLERRDPSLTGRVHHLREEGECSNDPALCNQAIYANRSFAPSLEAARQFTKEFVGHSIDAVYDEMISQPMERRHQFIDEIAMMMKFFSELGIRLGNQAKDEIFHNLRQFHLMETSTIRESLNNTLGWLLNRDSLDEIEQLKDELKSTLRQMCREAVNSNDLVLRDNTKICEHIDLVVKWCFDKTFRSKSIEIYIINQDVNAIRYVQQLCITVLVEKKIDQLTNKVKTLIINHLPDVVHETLKNNAEQITEEVTGRIAELLEEVDINNFFDSVTHLIHNHVKAYIKAKKKVTKRINNAEVKPKTPELIEEYLHTEIPDTFVSLPTTHEIVKNRVFGSKEHHDPELWKQSVTRMSIAARTNTVLDLILPTVTMEINDQVKEIDGLARLWNIIKFPDPFNSLIAEIEDFVGQILPSGVTLTNNIKTIIHKNIAEIIAAVGNVKLKKLIAEQFYQFYNKVAPPESLLKVFAGYFCPAIFGVMVGLFSENIVLHNIPLLEGVITDLKTGTDKGPLSRDFSAKLYELVKANCHQLDIESAGITEEVFANEVGVPMAKAIDQALNDEELQDKPFIEVFEKLFAKASGEKKSIYSEIVMDLIFKVGEFGSMTERVATLYTETISDMVSSIIHLVTKERYAAVDLCLKGLKGHFGTRESVKNLLFGERSIVDTSGERLEKELKNLAALTHDLAMEALNAATTSWWWTFVPQRAAVKALIGTDSTKIENLLRRLISRLASNEEPNASLFFQLQDLFVSTLQNADMHIRTDRGTGDADPTVT